MTNQIESGQELLDTLSNEQAELLKLLLEKEYRQTEYIKPYPREDEHEKSKCKERYNNTVRILVVLLHLNTYV